MLFWNPKIKSIETLDVNMHIQDGLLHGKDLHLDDYNVCDIADEKHEPIIVPRSDNSKTVAISNPIYRS